MSGASLRLAPMMKAGHGMEQFWHLLVEGP